MVARAAGDDNDMHDNVLIMASSDHSCPYLIHELADNTFPNQLNPTLSLPFPILPVCMAGSLCPNLRPRRQHWNESLVRGCHAMGFGGCRLGGSHPKMV